MELAAKSVLTPEQYDRFRATYLDRIFIPTDELRAQPEYAAARDDIEARIGGAFIQRRIHPVAGYFAPTLLR